MDLRELKREVEALPSLAETSQKLLQKVRLLSNFSPELQKEIDVKKKVMQHHIEEMAVAEHIRQRLQQQARLVVELKLAALQQDREKAGLIKEQLLHDEWCNFSYTLEQIKGLEQQAARLCVFYYDFSDFMQKNASLEHSLAFMEEQKAMKEMVAVIKLYKKLAFQLGKEFVNLAR